MAIYTSTQNGNWNNPATWGGGGWPQNAGDVANIGHNVTYNVSSTVEMGQITINSGGLLDFSRSMNTKLTLGHQNILINSGGELRVGSSGNIIPAAYTAELVWNTTADNAKGISCSDGGLLNIYGDPNYYGSLDRTTLASYWTSGQTFTAKGDFTTKWATGAILYVHGPQGAGGSYNNYNTDMRGPFTIASMSLSGGNTLITINEAAPGITFVAGGRVLNLGRNVHCYKLGYVTTIGNYNSNRPYLSLYNSSATTTRHYLSNVLLSGFYSITGNYPEYNMSVSNIAIRNSYFGFYNGNNHNISGIILSCNYAINSVGNFNSSAIICGCNYALGGGYFGTSDDELFSNNWALSGNSNCLLRGAVYANSQAIYTGRRSKFIGTLGWNSDVSVSMKNSADVRYNEGIEIDFINAKLPSGGMSLSRNSPAFKGRVKSEHHDQVANAHYIFDAYGDIVKTPADGTGDNPTQRSGGGADVFEVSPLSNCSTACYLEILNIRVWAPAGVARTYRYCVQSTFASLPTANFKFYGEYLDQGSGGHLATVSSTQNISTRSNQSDWSQYVEVTVTPVQEGWVNLYLRLMGYESGKKVWVDPALSVT